MKDVMIFTDGASRGNPGPGGFAAIIIFQDENNNRGGVQDSRFMIKELGGWEEYTTNNRMEMKAAIAALREVESCKLNAKRSVLYSDSSYLINGITKWVFGWQKNGWRTSNKEPVENQDLWEELLRVTIGQKINWHLVKGHVGVVGNYRCDEIATAFADRNKIALYSGTLHDYKIKKILDISADPERATKNSQSKSNSRAKAFSYVSAIDGKVEVHQTWDECEKRVKGKSGARFKKVFSQSEEASLVKEWQS